MWQQVYDPFGNPVLSTDAAGKPWAHRFGDNLVQDATASLNAWVTADIGPHRP